MAEIPDFPMEEFRSGNTNIYTNLFHHHYSSLCYFTKKITDDEPAAEDIVKDTFIKLWQKRRNFVTSQNIKAFLYITCRNAALNFVRHLEVRQATYKEMRYLGHDKEDAMVLENLIKTEILTLIYREIEKLPLQRRKIFKMAFVDGMKNEEIAKTLDISVSTVKTQKARSILALRAKFLGNAGLLLFAVYQLFRTILQKF